MLEAYGITDSGFALDAVTDALTALKPEGTFAVEASCPSDDLHIEIEGLGALRFPISAATARQLCALAKPAPHGLRDQTLFDKRVRDTWQLDRRQVQIDEDAWKRTLDPLLTRVRDGLGLAKKSKLKAVFDKMLVYAPKQFFAAHQDSERARDMVGTLVVELPSKHRGGATVVEHGGQKQTFQGARKGEKELSVLAFYADCRHEVEPVQTGYRVVLTYRLHHRGGPTREMPPDLGARIDTLAEAVEDYFSTPIERRWAGSKPERPSRLIYLLDHEYTQQSLGWDHLKNADRVRVSALREVAARLGYEVFLALADVHEEWSCYEEYDGYDEDGGGEHVLLDLIEDDVELYHWIGLDGGASRGIAAGASGDEICFTLPSSEMSPWKSEHEGYMGNYGNTLDRWYHRAALVMWPRERTFAIRAEVSPSWALTQIDQDLAARDVKAAIAKAKSLSPFWAEVAPREQHARFFPKLCKAALALDRADLASQLLSPFSVNRLTPAAHAPFVALVERYGLSWAQKLVSDWSAHQPYGEPSWLPLLPGLCEALTASPGEHGRPLAQWLLAREVTAFQKEVAKPSTRFVSESSADNTVARLASLFDAARVLGATTLRDELSASLMDPKANIPLMDLGKLLQRCREGRTPKETRALGLQTLYRHVVDALSTALAAPTRSPDDWSIEPPKGCRCALCKELAAFLRAKDRIEHAWPLAKDGRLHIQQIIEAHRLPVSHTTLRQGSPHRLVLHKQDALFEREKKLRDEQRALLTQLKRHRAAFGP